MAKNVTTTNTVAGKIYAEVAAKHPDWKQPRVYAGSQGSSCQNCSLIF